MITKKDIQRAQEDLEKLSFSPVGAIKTVLTGVGKGSAAAAKTLAASRKSVGEGALGFGLTSLAGVGLAAQLADVPTMGLAGKALGSVPVAGTAAKFLNPYSMLAPGGRAAERYKPLGEMYLRRGVNKNKAVYNPDKQNLSRYLANNSASMKKTSGVKMYSDDSVKRYYKIREGLQKTASVSKLRRAVQGSKAGGGDFARQALAYMAGATALGVGAPLIANTIGQGMDFARRGRLNRDYNAMLKQDPELKRDPQARQYFELLHRSSPYVAQEPVIAATVVRNLVDSPALDGKKFKDILDIERARQDTKNPLMKDPSGASRLMGMPMFEG